MKYYLYVRVSHESQVESGLSIDAQRENLVKYCVENNIVNYELVFDKGISGKSLKKREGMQYILKHCKSNDVILVQKLDRFSRNTYEALTIINDLNEKGILVKALYDDIDTTTSDGRFRLLIQLGLAEYEREKVSERIRTVFKHKINNGEMTTGKKVYGYDTVDKRLVINENEAVIVRECFNHYVLTHNLTELVRYMNENYDLGFSYRRLKYLLSNEFYIGKHKDNLEFCKPIIEKKTFDKVQKFLDHGQYTSKKHIFLFSKLIRCSHCGRVMCGNLSGGKWYIYRCNRAFQDAACDNRHSIAEKKIEKYLLENLESEMNKKHELYMKEKKKIKKASNDKKKIEEKINRTKELYIEGMISKDDLKAKISRFEHDLDMINKLHEEPKNKREIKKIMSNMEIYNALDREHKQMFWANIIKEISWDGINFEVIFY